MSDPTAAESARSTGTFRVKRGLAEMLKGGVIMDVVDSDQARIAEDAGACAVMALERVPADIRRDGGVARMSDPEMIEGIQAVVTIPVMAKARIGHFVEAQILQAIGVDYVDESEVLTPADDVHHIDKHQFAVPFVCGCRDLGEALRRIAEGVPVAPGVGPARTKVSPSPSGKRPKERPGGRARVSMPSTKRKSGVTSPIHWALSVSAKGRLEAGTTRRAPAATVAPAGKTKPPAPTGELTSL